MILPYQHILAWAESGGIDPFDPALVNPASIDLRIGSRIISLDMPGGELDCYTIDLWPGKPILATTVERIDLPADLAGAVYLKSSWARRGLDHALAGWIDPGFCGQLTLELHAHRPLAICPGAPVIQLVLMRLSEPTNKPYQGRYQNQAGPTRAR
jgi:dCTP deaminase